MPKVDKKQVSDDATNGEPTTEVQVKIPQVEIRCDGYQQIAQEFDRLSSKLLSMVSGANNAEATEIISKLAGMGVVRSPITAKEMKKVFGWETESEYKQRKLSEQPGVDISKVHFATEREVEDGQGEGAVPILLKNMSNEPVVCHYNSKNRPFDEAWSRRMAQELLERHWAGPTSWPGFTINGDTFKVNESDEVEDGQHRGIGLIIAHEIWSSDTDQGKKYRGEDYWPPEKYPDGPVLETIVVKGITDSWKLTQTLDNTKARSLTDTIYTSEIFSGLTWSKKEEVSRMLANALDFLWIRLRLGSGGESKVYKTHVGSHEWLSRHKKLLKLVEHIFALNEEPGRDLSAFSVKQKDGKFKKERSKLSPGACAGILFLQACSSSDPERYFAMEEPSERYLKWDMEDKAKEFWDGLATGYHHTDDPFVHVRQAILSVNSGLDPDSDDPDQKEEFVAPGIERNIILQKAWDLFKRDQPMTFRDIMPAMSEVHNEDGEVVGSRLAELSNFLGIDMGDKYKLKSDDKPGKTTVEDAKKEAEIKQTAKREKIAKGAESTVSSAKITKAFHEEKKRHPNRILLHPNKNVKQVRAFMEDADVLNEVLGLPVNDLSTGGRFAGIDPENLNEAIKKLTTAGYDVAEIRIDAMNKERATYYNSRKKSVRAPSAKDEEE